jgi:hypothetical protein
MIPLTVAGGRATGVAGCGVRAPRERRHDANGVRGVSRYPLAISLNRRKVSM